MALIYTLTDEAGVTHGKVDAELDGRARTGVLVGPIGPFAGQRLEVRYASMEGIPGTHPFLLEGGQRLYPTQQLHKLLCPPGCTRA